MLIKPPFLVFDPFLVKIGGYICYVLCLIELIVGAFADNLETGLSMLLLSEDSEGEELESDSSSEEVSSTSEGRGILPYSSSKCFSDKPSRFFRRVSILSLFLRSSLRNLFYNNKLCV